MNKEIKRIKFEGIYRVFENKCEIETWVNSLDKNVAKNIFYQGNSYNDINGSTLKMYCGFNSIDVNYFLYYNKTHKPYLFEEDRINGLKVFITRLDNILSDKKLDENTVAVHWLKKINFQSYFGISLHSIRKDSVYFYKGYLSTSVWVNYIGQYDMVPRSINDHVLLLLKVPKGINGIYVEGDISNRNEYELLIHRGCYLKINRIQYVLFKPFLIVCEVVDSERSLE